MTDDLPLYTHELVLGADIGVHQRDCHRHEYTGHTARETSVNVEPFEAHVTQQRQRRYLAAWARRTIERPASDSERGP